MKKNRAEAKKSILAWVEVKERPFLVGEVALLLGSAWSIRETEGLLAELSQEGRIRSLTAAERKKHEIQHGYISV